MGYFDFSEIETFTGTQEGEYGGRAGRKSVGKTIENLLRVYPNRDNETGQLFHSKGEKKGKHSKFSVHGLFVSDEGNFVLRRHEFESEVERTPEEIERWLGRHYGKILGEDILSGMENFTGGQFWRLYRPIGWTPDNDSRRAKNSRSRKKRDKSKHAKR